MIDDQPLASHASGRSRSAPFRVAGVSETRSWCRGQGRVILAGSCRAGGVERVGPVSGEQPEVGMAGLCTLAGQRPGGGVVQVAAAAGARGVDHRRARRPSPRGPSTSPSWPGERFRLRLKETTLGILPLAPAPTAAFTNEGTFKSVADFSWSPAAEEQLNERLGRLMDGPRSNPFRTVKDNPHPRPLPETGRGAVASSPSEHREGMPVGVPCAVEPHTAAERARGGVSGR